MCHFLSTFWFFLFFPRYLEHTWLNIYQLLHALVSQWMSSSVWQRLNTAAALFRTTFNGLKLTELKSIVLIVPLSCFHVRTVKHRTSPRLLLLSQFGLARTTLCIESSVLWKTCLYNKSFFFGQTRTKLEAGSSYDQNSLLWLPIITSTTHANEKKTHEIP